MDSKFYATVVTELKKIAKLENYLSEHSDDEILQLKTAQCRWLFDQIKEAGILDALRNVGRKVTERAGKAVAEGPIGKQTAEAARQEVRKSFGDYLAHPVARGAMYSAGAAVPATLAGSYLIGRGGEESRKSIEDLRNKALQTALGVGGIGAGLYALHRFTRPTKRQNVSYRRNEEGKLVPTYVSMSKMSSDTNETLLLEKLGTVAFLDTILDAQEKTADIQECSALNAEHGIDILRQLLDE